MNKSQLRVALVVAVFTINVCVSNTALSNGGKGKTAKYTGQIKIGQGTDKIEFSTEIERVLFLLNSVENKYKVVRIKINNLSKNALRLSREKDRIELHFNDGSGVLSGMLDISNRDPIFWNTFNREMKEILLYPEIVEPGEEENIFVFIAKGNFKEVPQQIIYKINSMPKTPAIISTDRGPVQKL